MDTNTAIEQAAEAVLGKKFVEMFDNLLKATSINGTRRTVAAVFAQAIRSKYSGEEKRLRGVLRNIIAENHVPAERAKKIYFACGMLGDQTGNDIFADFDEVES